MRSSRGLMLLTGLAWAMFSSSSVAAIPMGGVQHVSAGGAGTCALIGGGVQCWGVATSEIFEDPQSGIHYYSANSGTPVGVPGLNSGATAIARGGDHACAIVTGKVECWGDGTAGDLGILGGSSYPMLVSGLSSGVTQVSVGGINSCAIVAGAAKCWGDNSHGQLGSSAVASGNVVGSSSATPVAVDGLSSGVSKIINSFGFASLYAEAHTCAIVNGGAWCWGGDSVGQLGNDLFTDDYSPTPLAVTGLASGVTAITAGVQHTCAVVDGAAVCWGGNCSGVLGTSTPPPSCSASSATPVSVSGLTSHVIAISAGAFHNCALVDNDQQHPIKCWGDNSSGQLGNNSITSSSTPVSVNFFPALASGDPALGTGDSMVELAAGTAHECVLVKNNPTGATRLLCWGDNEVGELAISGGTNLQSDGPVQVVGFTSGVTSIGSGSTSNHACAVVGATAKCWGLNVNGELGDGGQTDRGLPFAVSGLSTGVTAVAAGPASTCAIVNGAAMCWGTQYTGELGDGTTYVNHYVPAAVSGLTSGVTKLALGGGFASRYGEVVQNGTACAIVNGGAQCWGSNAFGQLGSSAVNWGVDEFNNAYVSAVPVAVDNLSAGVTDLALGENTSCAVVSGAVQCWGRMVGSDLPIAIDGLAAGTTAITVGTGHTCAISGGAVQCWGDNSQGQLGNVNFTSGSSSTPINVTGLGSGAIALAAGATHTCAVVNGGVQCWGSSSLGQLGAHFTPCGGDSSFNSCNAPVTVAGLGPSSGVTAVTSGGNFSCALLNTGAEKCWGDDIYGELGDGRLLSVEAPQVVAEADEIFRSLLGG